MTPITTNPAPALAWRHCAWIVLGTLALSLFFHAPRLWILFGPPMPGATCWARGLQFSLQCEQPFGSEVLDPGLIWRLAPALLGWSLHLQGSACFVIPWAGLLVMLFLCARLAWRLTHDLISTGLFTALIGTTSATLIVTGWLGMNDAWYAGALLVIALQPQVALLAVAALIGPWIDERFVLAVPLACYVHVRMLGTGQLKTLLGCVALGIFFYLAVRLVNPIGLPTKGIADYLAYCLTHFQDWLPWSGLGWFMGLRSAWLLVLLPGIILVLQRQARHALLLAALVVLPLCAITFVAADTARAPTMLLPLLFLGLAQVNAQAEPGLLRRILAGLLVANLAMPAMHVTYKYSDLINILPIEIARLLAH